MQNVTTRYLMRCYHISNLSSKNYVSTYIKYKGISLLFFFFLAHNTLAQEYNFRNFSVEEGLARPYVYSIVQDIQGYLWVGTDNGLSKYNGFKFENFTTRDSLADNFATCSIRDGKNLWFGHPNGRLSFYDGKSFHTVSYPAKELSPITHLVKSPDGQVWISTLTNGLFKLENNKIVFENIIFKNQQPIYSFEFLSNNELLLGTGSGLKYCKLGNTHEIEIFRPVIEIPESKVTCIARMKNGSGFYIATENEGIFKLTADNTLLDVSKINSDASLDLTGIQDLYEDSQSNVWLATFGNGLIKMVPDKTGVMKITIYNKSSKFATDNVKTVYEDLEGNIWIGNYGDGLTQITSKPFSLFKFDKTIYGNSVFSIYSDQHYRWIGTEIGLAKIDQITDKVIKFYTRENGLPKDTITSIYSANGKELWIGTYKNGVFQMNTENSKISKYFIGNGTLENSITTITGKGDQVWIGSKKGLYNINLTTNNINEYSINKFGLPHNVINCLYLDKKERLWVTTSSSTLAYIQNGKVFKLPLSSSTGILTLGPVTEDSASRIWVGSNGSGVFMIESDSIINLTTKEGLLSNYCYSLIGDDQNNIWVGHKGGLSIINITDFAVKQKQHIEGVSEDYQFNPNAIMRDQSRKIWFGSNKGLVSYDPSKELPQSEPPVLGITSIKINDNETGFTDNKIVLSPGIYKIRIDFRGVSLKDPSLVTYQYRLEGFDQWSEISKNSSVTYYHITEGVYTFDVKACSGDGAVTETPLSIRFIIKKPLWNKWWFYPVSILIITMVVYIYLKWHINRITVEKRILEEKVLERTLEIQRQKNEIELQRDEIDMKNENITSSITYARHIQDAVTPQAELLDQLLPDNFILNKPKDIVSGDFYWMTEKDKKIIFAVADCTGHGVPGAFMSLLGITLLNEIVNILGITRSDIIVTVLRERLIQSLQQNSKDETARDGMDIALCVLDRHHNKLQYTGGMSDLIYISGGKLEIIKSDLMDVSASYNVLRKFKMNERDCKKGDVMYLFSDGYQDQFGGNYDRKFLRSHFYNTLFEIHHLPMKSQKEILERKLNEWMRDPIQTDDITVMGIRL